MQNNLRNVESLLKKLLENQNKRQDMSEFCEYRKSTSVDFLEPKKNNPFLDQQDPPFRRSFASEIEQGEREFCVTHATSPDKKVSN